MRAILGDADFESAWAEGTTLTLKAALSEAYDLMLCDM